MSRLTVILHLLVPHSSVKKMATCTGDKASCYLKPSSRRWGATDITERNTRFACVSYTMTPPMLRVAMTSEDQPYVVHRKWRGGILSPPYSIHAYQLRLGIWRISSGASRIRRQPHATHPRAAVPTKTGARTGPGSPPRACTSSHRPSSPEEGLQLR
jgi:hypothetical protein